MKVRLVALSLGDYCDHTERKISSTCSSVIFYKQSFGFIREDSIRCRSRLVIWIALQKLPRIKTIQRILPVILRQTNERKRRQLKRARTLSTNTVLPMCPLSRPRNFESDYGRLGKRRRCWSIVDRRRNGASLACLGPSQRPRSTRNFPREMSRLGWSCVTARSGFARPQ